MKVNPGAILGATRALKLLSVLMRYHFGQKSTSHSGERTIYIGPDKIEMTNEHGTIIAKGPARIATVLVRKRRRVK